MNKTNASPEIVFSTIDSEVLSVLLKDFTTQKAYFGLQMLMQKKAPAIRRQTK